VGTLVEKVDLQWAYRLLGFGPVVLVSTTDGEKGDVSAVAWCAPAEMDPPVAMLAIATEHKTYENLSRTGILGINVPTAENVDLVMYCGTKSGHEVDKIRDGNIPVRFGEAFPSLPLIDSCAAWLECKVLPGTEAGGHGIVMAEVLAASCRPGVLTRNHIWDVAHYPTLHHLGGPHFVVGTRIVSGR
jgi:flavin reductase (DIM6/NTAB) family NADH-FMN oxidoreductase RutF